MNNLHHLLLLFALCVAVSVYGIRAVITGETSGFIFIFGGVVITAIAAGIIGKAHAKDKADAGR